MHGVALQLFGDVIRVVWSSLTQRLEVEEEVRHSAASLRVRGARVAQAQSHQGASDDVRVGLRQATWAAVGSIMRVGTNASHTGTEKGQQRVGWIGDSSGGRGARLEGAREKKEEGTPASRTGDQRSWTATVVATPEASKERLVQEK